VKTASFTDEQGLASPLAAPARPGRPTIYTEALVDRLIEALLNGYGLRAISRMAGMPSPMTVARWRRTNPEFSALYKGARRLQLDMMADDILDIADNGRSDVSRDRLRTGSRKWLFSKLARHVFGTTALVEQVAEEASDIDYTKLTDDEFNTMLVLLEKASRGNDAA
jgi:hypothetical protein